MLPHPLRMAHRLVAAAADRYQVSLLGSVLVGVVPTECELRKSFDMPDMMHKLRSIGSAANLAVSVIVPEDRGGQLPPFPADVERVNIPGSDQTQEPLQKTLSHRQKQKEAMTATTNRYSHGLLGSKGKILTTRRTLHRSQNTGSLVTLVSDRVSSSFLLHFGHRTSVPGTIARVCTGLPFLLDVIISYCCSFFNLFSKVSIFLFLLSRR